MKKNKILFVTTANLSTNPRLLKELLYLKKKGFNCEVLAFELGNWYDENDRNILLEQQLDVKYISASRSPFIPWLKSSLVQVWAQRGWNSKSSLKRTAYASNKRSYLLKKTLDSYSTDYDLLIAHNLAALFPAYDFCKKNAIPLGFDVEDYHPGEIIETDQSNERNRRLRLMQEILPTCAYVSFASPLIEKETKSLTKLVEDKCLYISNSFFSNEFFAPEGNLLNQIQLLWFSQYISYGRGLEVFLKAADNYKDKLHITIIGAHNEDFFKNELADRNYVSVIEPMSQLDLHKSLKNFDVGLAIEIGSVDLNKELCISNKIFAYAQAGLYILASNTKGQEHFLAKHPTSGILSGQSVDEFKLAIEKILGDKDAIIATSSERFENSKILSYELQAEKLLLKLKNILEA